MPRNRRLYTNSASREALFCTGKYLVGRYHLNPGNHFVARVLARTTHVTSRRLREIGIVAFVYAALFLAEGVGLWSLQRWGEWITVLITGSLLPFEIYELWHRLTLPRAAVLVLNAAIVCYLVISLRKRRAIDAGMRFRLTGARAVFATQVPLRTCNVPQHDLRCEYAEYQAGELEMTNSTIAMNAIVEANRSGKRQNDQERNHEKDFCCRRSRSAMLPNDADKRRVASLQDAEFPLNCEATTCCVYMSNEIGLLREMCAFRDQSHCAGSRIFSRYHQLSARRVAVPPRVTSLRRSPSRPSPCTSPSRNSSHPPPDRHPAPQNPRPCPFPRGPWPAL